MLKPPIAPIAQAERIQVLDILRGFALFGVLVVNMSYYRGTYATPTPFDTTLENLISTLIQGKFYIIFSFLFGVGFAVQLKRAHARGVNLLSFYPRRLLVLLAFGLLHYFFLWDGDILRLYAMMGFILLLLHTAPPKLLLSSAALVLLASPLLPRIADRLLSDGGASTTEALLATGSYWEITAARTGGFFIETFLILIYQGTIVLALFLLGLYAGQRGIFEHLTENRRLFQWGMIGGLVAGMIGIPTGIFILSAPGLACMFVCAICLLAQHPKAAMWLSPLAWLGRMALTNYIMQSLICTTIFYGYGLGLYGKVSTSASFLLIFALYLGQILISRLWLQRFRYGPLEWLWRSLTYGKRQPMLKPESANDKNFP